MHETGRHGVATSVLPQGVGGKLSRNLFDRPRKKRWQKTSPTTKENCRWDWWALLAERESLPL